MDSSVIRQQAANQQLRTCHVLDEDILGIFLDVAREDFVPPPFKGVAYSDDEIPLPHGQVMLRPMLVARILQDLDISASDRILEIGTGSGYLTTCLARQAQHVHSIELFEDLREDAQKNLRAAQVDNVQLETMDASNELPEGNFDAIVVTASMPQLDPALSQKLNSGGRMFVVLGDAPVMQAILLSKEGNELKQQVLFETCIPPLLTQNPDSEFSF